MNPYSYLAFSIFPTGPKECHSDGAVTRSGNGPLHPLRFNDGRSSDVAPLKLVYLSRPAGAKHNRRPPLRVIARKV
jgi:hypothetical protein